MILRSTRKIKEGTIPTVQTSYKEIIREVHIPCTFNIFTLRNNYTKCSLDCNW